MTDGPMLVIDLEATCDEPGTFRLPRTTLEIAVVAYSADRQLPAEFQSFVRPSPPARLTPFCERLTGIRARDVEKAPRFPKAWQQLVKWLASCRIPLEDACWGSWGSFDRVLLHRDGRRHGVPVPEDGNWLDLRSRFSEVFRCRPLGLAAALQRTGQTFEGRPHRAIEDARNLCRLLPHLGWGGSAESILPG